MDSFAQSLLFKRDKARSAIGLFFKLSFTGVLESKYTTMDVTNNELQRASQTAFCVQDCRLGDND